MARGKSNKLSRESSASLGQGIGLGKRFPPVRETTASRSKQRDSGVVNGSGKTAKVTSKSRSESSSPSSTRDGQISDNGAETKTTKKSSTKEVTRPAYKRKLYNEATATRPDRILRNKAEQQQVTVSWTVTYIAGHYVLPVPFGVSHDLAVSLDPKTSKCIECGSKLVTSAGWVRRADNYLSPDITATMVTTCAVSCKHNNCFADYSIALVSLPNKKKTPITGRPYIEDLTTEGVEPNPGPGIENTIYFESAEYTYTAPGTLVVTMPLTIAGEVSEHSLTWYSATVGARMAASIPGSAGSSFRLVANANRPTQTWTVIGPSPTQPINVTSASNGVVVRNSRKYNVQPAASTVWDSTFTSKGMAPPIPYEEVTTDIVRSGDVETNPGPQSILPGYFNSHRFGVAGSPTILFQETPPTPPIGGGTLQLLTVSYASSPTAITPMEVQVIGYPDGANLTGSVVMMPGESVAIMVRQQATVRYALMALANVGTAQRIGVNLFLLSPAETAIRPNVTVTTPVAITASAPLDVNITSGSVDAFITNTSLPVEIDTGEGGLPVAISESSFPLWISGFGPQAPPSSLFSKVFPRPPHKKDLLICGDIESNPGPPDSHTGMMPLIPKPTLPPLPKIERPRTRVAPTNEDYVIDMSALPASNVNAGLPTNSWTIERVHQRVIAKASCGSPKVSAYFSLIGYLEGILSENIFDALTEVTDDGDYFQKVGDKPRSRSPKTEAKQHVERPRPQSAPTPATTKATETPEELAKRLDTIVSRIVSKFEKDLRQCVSWLSRPHLNRRFVELIANRLFGAGWMDHVDFCQYRLLFYSHINAIPAKVVIAKLYQFDSQYGDYADIFDNLRADLELANLHNKVMHASNGNILSRSMADVDEAPTRDSILRGAANRKLPLYTGYEAQIAITNVAGDENPNQTGLFYQDRLRASVRYAANDITQMAASTIPTTNLIPRQWVYTRPDGGQEVVVDEFGANVTEVNIAEYFANPIEPTELSRNTSNAVAVSQTSTWRRDNTTLSGFSMFDVASINTTLIPKGLSLEAVLLKLDLLHSILTIRQPTNQFPSSSWSVVNVSHIPQMDDIPDIGINNSPVPGEDCGGNNPVFPWGGGKGEVAFHLTIATVPVERRHNVVFMPTALLQASEEGSEAISMFALMWAEWPFGIYTYAKALEYRGAGVPPGPFEATYVPTQTWTRVPGLRTLDIVLPRTMSEQNPRTQDDANAMAVVRPRFGNRATVAHAVGAPININFVGGAVQSVPLTDYLYSWSTYWDVASIKQFLGRLAVSVGVKDTLEAVHEMNIALCQQVPSMWTSDGTAPPRTYPELIGEEGMLQYMHQINYVNHTRVTEAPLNGAPLNAKFPIINTIAADYRVFETNISVWNKVVLGLATAPNIAAELMTQLPPHIGDARCHWWERLQAIPMLASWAAFYYSLGLTTQAWNDSYTSTLSPFLGYVSRNTYCTTHTTGTLLPSKWEHILIKFMEQMYERSPATVVSSVANKPLLVTHFGRWLPQTRYASVIHSDAPPREWYCFTPVLLPDIWIQYLARKLPKFMSSFPPPGGYDSTRGYSYKQDPKLKVHRNNNLHLVGSYLESDLPAVYPIRAGPDVSDLVKWNTRLWYTHPNAQMLNYSAQPIAEPSPESLYRPTGRAVFLDADAGETYPLEILNQSTMCIPEMSTDGSRIVLYLTQAQSVPLINACNRATVLARAVWLLDQVYIEPQIQAIGEMSTQFDKYDVLEESDFTNASSVDNVMASAAETSSQAPEPEQLPSSIQLSNIVEQPAPSAAPTA